MFYNSELISLTSYKVKLKLTVFTAWLPTVKEIMIDHDLESKPLKIITNTDTLNGEVEHIRVTFYDASENLAGHVQIDLRKDFNMYMVRYCQIGWLPYTCETVNKLWTITKEPGPRVKIHCNDTLIEDLLISASTCNDPEWSQTWIRDISKMKFRGSASDFYFGTAAGGQQKHNQLIIISHFATYNQYKYKIIVSADKSSNLYNVDVEEYQKLVRDNVTKTYKKAPSDTSTKINKEAAVLVGKLDLSDRVQVHTNNECFVTFKDHKPNFYAAKQCRLINPAKTEVGRISKQILEKIVLEVREKTRSNLWKNTQSVLQWFSNLSYGVRAKAKFIQFDIESFYPTITEELLTKALQYAQTMVKMDQTEVEIIFHSRKALLFNNSECWVKKSGELFDVTMGAYDGAEVCEIVGLYLLSKIHKIIPISYIGLYRDDGLAVIPNANGPKLDRIRKDLIKCFKEENLQITTIINLPEVDFLDVHLNLKAGSFKPFRKENDQPQYVHCDSNHPKSITKNIPEMIGKRISGLSSDKSTFERKNNVRKRTEIKRVQ